MGLKKGKLRWTRSVALTIPVMEYVAKRADEEGRTFSGWLNRLVEKEMLRGQSAKITPIDKDRAAIS